MPTKKAAARKKPSRKKAARKKPAAKKRVAKKAARPSTKRKSSKKKPAKKASKKKKAPATKKRVSKKKVTKRKPAKKKKTSKKARAKKVTKKKAPKAKKKTSSKKRPSTKKSAAKKTGSKRKKVAPKTAAKKRAQTRRMDLLTNPSAATGPYQPKRGESYMSGAQLEHFRSLLTNWKRELMEEVDRTMLHMKDEAANFPDPNDRATQESEFGLELRTRDRERKLLRKIDSALQRIDDGTYGYCEETGEEIGLRRLEARPVATLCVEAQERRELAERQYRDRDDQYR
jgi:DnaK suppressor protein